jgi:ligand-binding sensor domain-containing protein
MKSHLFTSLILLFFHSANAQVSLFRHYTSNDGIANSMVYYAMQDSKGYMWFCTESGINRFDGLHFETFTINDGLADNENFRCIEDRKGRIWFASYNGRLCYYNGKTFVNEKTDASLRQTAYKHNQIEDIIEDSKGNVWFSKLYTDSIYRYNGKTIKSFLAKPNAHLNSSYSKLLFLYRGHVNYFRIEDSGCWREDLESGKSYALKTIGGAFQYPYGPPRVCRINAHQFYFTSGSGLSMFSNDTLFLKLKTGHFNNDNSSFITLKRVHDEIWIVSVNGLVRIKNHTATGFKGPYENHLKGIFLSHITSDSEGGLWVTSLSNGIYYLPPSAGFISNIKTDAITSISCSNYNGSVGVGTFEGEFKLLKNDHLILKYKFNRSKSNRIKNLKWISKDQLLLGNDNSPYVYNLIDKTITLVYGNGINGCSDIDEGAAGIWIGCRHEILLLKGKKLDLIYGNFDLTNQKLISIAEGGKKGCWFATIGKLYWLDLASKRATLLADGRLFNSNLKDLRCVNNTLWVATDGNGIFVFKNGKLVKRIHSGTTKLTSNICQKLVFDGKSEVWVATNRGITVLDVTNYNCLYSFTTNDALISNDIRDLALGNNKAYVATPAGVSIIDRTKLIRKSSSPFLHLKNIVVQGKSYPLTKLPAFYYSKGVVKLNYTGITFLSRSALTFRYKFLTGNDDWNETTSDQLELVDLAPGEYTLLISAKKHNSDWSTPVLARFTILPLWHQTVWFKALLFAVLLLAITIMIYRFFQEKKRKIEIEKHILQSEIRAIRLYMNPHFIYNTLNSLQYFIFKNKSLEANAYIARFSRLIRWTMSYSEKQSILLQEELDFLNTYIELEQLRFEKGFKVLITVDENLDPMLTSIPPLIIQPFVENAIKYGLTEKKENGLLKIQFKKKENFILVTVKDNGVGREKVQKEQANFFNKKPSTGIKYTEERLLLLLSGKKVTKPLTITDLYANGNACGTKIEICLPTFS